MTNAINFVKANYYYFIGAAGVALVAALIFIPDVASAIAGLGMIAVLIIAGFALAGIPIIIAVARKHHQTGIIVALSLLGLIPFVGWLFWIVALIIAAATSATPVQRVAVAPQYAAPQPEVQYGLGSQVNGYTLVSSDQGQVWVQR